MSNANPGRETVDELERRLGAKPVRKVVFPLPTGARTVSVKGFADTHDEALAAIALRPATVKRDRPTDGTHPDGSEWKAQTLQLVKANGQELYRGYVAALTPAAPAPSDPPAADPAAKPRPARRPGAPLADGVAAG